MLQVDPPPEIHKSASDTGPSTSVDIEAQQSTSHRTRKLGLPTGFHHSKEHDLQQRKISAPAEIVGDHRKKSYVPSFLTPHRGSELERSVSTDASKAEGIMKKIPPDAEATTVLVGELDCLKSPALCLVRLAEGTLLDGLTEVPIPVRFMFVLLGPGERKVDYHEIGRCFSTLMSSEVSCIIFLLNIHFMFLASEL